VTEWLVVTLMAPLASFGERAGNAERSTADRPTRSALIGLAGAALGIRRDDAAGQARLAAGLRTAVLTVDPGTLLMDFHTYQSLPSGRGRRPATRAEALHDRAEIVTSITRREYRSDVWYEAAYTVNIGAEISLADLESAFREPSFPLFLGRRSCPLGAPLDPRIEEAGDLVALFARRHAASPHLDGATPLRDGRRAARPPGPISAERTRDLGERNAVQRRLRRIDDPLDRSTWQFAARDEFVLAWPNGDEEALA
jgi:CRISPR system Cascade subunit CasD